MMLITCPIETRFLTALRAAVAPAAREAAHGAYDRHLDRCEAMTCSELRAEREDSLAEIAAERRMDEVMGGFTRGSYESYLEDSHEREMAATFGTHYQA